MKKNILSKIMAILALVWIIASIIWTGIILIIFSWTNTNTSNEMIQDDLQELLKKYGSWTETSSSTLTGTLNNTWSIEKSNTWEINQ